MKPEYRIILENIFGDNEELAYQQQLIFGDICREYGSRQVVTLLCDLFGEETVAKGLSEVMGTAALSSQAKISIYIHNRNDVDPYGLDERRSFFE